MSRVWAPCAAVLVVLFAVPTTATAKLSPISGRLSKPGYTVIALAPNGAARSVRASHGKFRLRPPARRVTLHLRAPSGTYSGPIAIVPANSKKSRKKAAKANGKKSRVLLGVLAGAKLGRIVIRPSLGYAKAQRRVPARWVDLSRVGRATGKGVPIGNGLNVGLVRSSARGPGDDPDLDGVPNSIDVDDDGDLVLDGYDPKTGAHKVARQSLDTPHPVPFMSPITRLWTGAAVNVNGGSSDEQIAAVQRGYGQIAILWGGVDPGSAELDCGALVYCAAGGTGRYRPSGFAQLSDSTPFPACCDADGDGLGSLLDTPPSDAAHDFHGMSLYTGASDEQIGAGDVLIERATKDKAPVEVASSMGFVFSTYPVLAAYDDGQGDSGTFSYPHEEPQWIPVRAGADGAVVLRLSFWRPQRRRLETEPGDGKWTDVGHLDYTASTPPPFDVSANPIPNYYECPASSYSGIDSSLSLQPSPGKLPPGYNGSHLEDQADDQPSNPANTFSYTMNLTDCLAANGQTLTTSQPANIMFIAVAVAPPSLADVVFTAHFQLLP